MACVVVLQAENYLKASYSGMPYLLSNVVESIEISERLIWKLDPCISGRINYSLVPNSM